VPAEQLAPGNGRPASAAARARRRARLARGPVTIGEPSPAVEPRLADGDPYRPDTVADGGTAFGLVVRAASVRGLAKRYLGGPRQDDVCLRPHADTNTLVVAVADGVSAAPRSDLGAALAVRHAAAATVRQLDRRGAGALDWEEVFHQAAWSLVEEHRRAAGDQHAGVVEASGTLATTLLVAAVTPAQDGLPVRVQVAAVGDSPAYVLEEGEFRVLVGPPDGADGLIGGGVHALPRSVEPPVTDDGALEGSSVLLLCTDGLALPLADGTGDVGRTLARELSRPPDVVDFARLLDFSRSTYDDDRTLVAVWCGRAR
jgi:serine/threonine protein phosphatase PrpC